MGIKYTSEMIENMSFKEFDELLKTLTLKELFELPAASITPKMQDYRHFSDYDVHFDENLKNGKLKGMK